MRHMRNKLAHEIKKTPRIKGTKAYNAAEAAWSFFKLIDDEKATSFESTINRREKFE